MDIGKLTLSSLLFLNTLNDGSSNLTKASFPYCQMELTYTLCFYSLLIALLEVKI